MDKKYLFYSVLAIGLTIIIYGYLQYVAKMNVIKNEREQTNIKDLRMKYCLENAYTNYMADWDSKCEIEGLGKDCTLMQFQSDPINKSLNQEKDRCVEMYK